MEKVQAFPMRNTQAKIKGFTAHFKGQSLVEFALVLPILLLIIMGVFDLGRLFYIKVALNSAAREGAYYLSYNPSDYVSATVHPDTDAAVMAELDNLGIASDDVLITINFETPLVLEPEPGEWVQVVVAQQNIELLIFGFLTDSINLQSEVRMMVQ